LALYPPGVVWELAPLACRLVQANQARERPMKTVWIYVDTNKQVGDGEYLKVFASNEAAEHWLEEHAPEGVAVEYPVIVRAT